MRKLLAGISLGLGTAALVLLLGYTGWLETLELKSYDWRMRTLADLPASKGQPLVHPDIVLVEINDLSLQELAPLVGRWPWPRALMGLLVDYLNRGQPKTIVLDIGYWEPERESTYQFLGQPWSSAQSDQALADAVRRAGDVVVLADATAPGLVDGEVKQTPWSAPAYRLGPAIEERPVITPPIPALAAAASGLGHNFLALDPDGPARRIAPFVRQGDRYLPSLGLAAVLRAQNIRPDEVVLEGSSIALRDVRIPLVAFEVQDLATGGRHLQQTMMINYRAPVLVNGERPFPSYEVRHLLKSEGQIIEGAKPDVDPALFKDKIVFVGLTGAGLLDAFQTPLGRGTVPGIQLHASVADSILSNRFIQPASRWIAPATIVAGALVVGLMAAMLPFSAAAAGALLLAVAYAGAATYGFSQGLWLSLVQPMLSVAVALFAGTAYRYFVEDAEKRKVSRLFGRYVSKDVYQQLMANPGLAELGGQRREMTVLFSDIRGFTSITEKGSPEDLVAQLNEYFSRMVEVVFRHGGTVDKFVGDMVMALFGAPVADDRHADHAVAAAVEMVDQLRQLNTEWASQGKATLDIGIGVNSGEMIAGNIGSSSIMSYTVIGDNVNLGARLESLNKEYGTRIIMSDATRTRLTTEFTTRPLGSVIVKGKTRPVDIFEIRVPSPCAGERPGLAGSRGKHDMKRLTFTLAVLLCATPASAQFGKLGEIANKAAKVKKIADVKVTAAEERQIGQQVSDQIVEEFGVYQDREVTKYVALVGSVLAQASTRPDLDWQFVVLDTEGVNAFAAPGGFVHITKGLLGLMKNEAELAGVLGARGDPRHREAHHQRHPEERHGECRVRRSELVGRDDQHTGREVRRCRVQECPKQPVQPQRRRRVRREGRLARQQTRLRSHRPGRCADEAGRPHGGTAGAKRPVRVTPRHQGSHRQDRAADQIEESDGHRNRRGAIYRHHQVRRQADRPGGFGSRGLARPGR